MNIEKWLVDFHMVFLRHTMGRKKVWTTAFS
jgi:hypothetical protein